MVDNTDYWKGGFRDHEHKSFKNVFNGVLMLIVFLPSIAFVTITYKKGVDSAKIGDLDSWLNLEQSKKGEGDMWKFAFLNPLAMVNILFFINVDVLFWIIGLCQKSFWLIDPYWTLLPPMFGLMWVMHPLAVFGIRT